MVLCHATRTKTNFNDKNIFFESMLEEDSVILEFCKKNNYSFDSSIKYKNNTVYNIKIEDELFSYPLVVINEYTTKRNR